MYDQRGRNKRRTHKKGNKMTEAITLHLDYHTRSDRRELRNDIMLLALGLDYEASKYGVRLACSSTPGERRLDLVLFGESSRLEGFLEKLRTKKLEYMTVDDYDISEPQPYDGKTPDWRYHDLVASARAAYLRTEYVKDVRTLLEQLVRQKSKK